MPSVRSPCTVCICIRPKRGTPAGYCFVCAAVSGRRILAAWFVKRVSPVFHLNASIIRFRIRIAHIRMQCARSYASAQVQYIKSIVIFQVLYHTFAVLAGSAVTVFQRIMQHCTAGRFCEPQSGTSNTIPRTKQGLAALPSPSPVRFSYSRMTNRPVPVQLDRQTHRACLTLSGRCSALRLLCTRNAPDTDVCVRRFGSYGSLRNSPILRIIFYYTHHKMSRHAPAFQHVIQISRIQYDLFCIRCTKSEFAFFDCFCRIVPHETFQKLCDSEICCANTFFSAPFTAASIIGAKSTAACASATSASRGRSFG